MAAVGGRLRAGQAAAHSGSRGPPTRRRGLTLFFFSVLLFVPFNTEEYFNIS
jgi:hypothetical protein